ncbi:MAG TPA: PA2778 family cysteine peptidase [Gallionellaceae bacterium]
MVSWHDARTLAGVFFLALLAGCVTPQTAALRSAPPAGLPEQFELEQVAFYAQEEHQCGPAALAIALQHAGRNVAPEQLKELLYLPEKQGSLQAEMLASARRNGTLAYVLKPQLQDVLSEVAAGNPVLVLQNLGLSWYPVWHYAVVVGYDLRSEEMILRSGLERRQLLPFITFENTWARSGHWAMLVLPPGRLPQTASADEYVQSIVALEHSSPATDTWPAYQAALARWPDNLLARISAGNLAYSHGRLQQAQEMLQAAVQQHPDSVAALNNLAQVLSDQGNYEAAQPLAQQAVALGGPLNAQARSTLAEIEQHLGAQRNRK